MYIEISAFYNLDDGYKKILITMDNSPSTSPADAAYSPDRLINEWKIIRPVK